MPTDKTQAQDTMHIPSQVCSALCSTPQPRLLLHEPPRLSGPLNYSLELRVLYPVSGRLHPNLIGREMGLEGDTVPKSKREPQKLKEGEKPTSIQKLWVGFFRHPDLGLQSRAEVEAHYQRRLLSLIFQGGGEAAGSSSLGPSEVRSAEAMGLTIAVRTGLQPAERLWIGRLSHHGLQCSPLRNGRNEGLTSRSCHVPGARRRRAREGKEVLGGWGRNCHCLAPLGHHSHAPASAASRVPRLQHVPREPSRRSFQFGRTGAWHGGPLPAPVPW